MMPPWTTSTSATNQRFSGASRIILLSTLLFAIPGIWAYFGTLDEVSTGSGKVIPSSREQVLQSLDGGSSPN